MKKLLKLFLVVGLCVSLVGCSAPKKEPQPKDTVADLLDSYKAQDFEKVSTFFSDDLIDQEDLNLNDIPESQKELQQLVYDKLTDIDYTIDEETVNDNQATVKVTITANNVGTQLTKGIGEAFTLAFSLGFSGATEEEIEKQTTEAMFAPLKECEKNLTYTVDVNLEKDSEGKWIISDDNKALVNAMSGGLLDVVEELEQKAE